MKLLIWEDFSRTGTRSGGGGSQKGDAEQRET